MIMLLVLGAGCLGGAIFLAAEALVRPRRELRLSIERAARLERHVEVGVEDVVLAERAPRERAPLSRSAAMLVVRLSPRTSLDAVGFRLARAGLSRRIGPHEYLAARLALGAGGAVAGMVFGVAEGSALVATFFAAAVGALGFFGPELVVNARLRARRDAIRGAL